jgi:hypothetical protein
MRPRRAYLGSEAAGSQGTGPLPFCVTYTHAEFAATLLARSGKL